MTTKTAGAGLSSTQGLQDAVQAVLDVTRKTDTVSAWKADLGRFFEDIRSADQTTRATLEFQRRLWNDNPVSAVGQGNINVDAILANTEFREWLAARSMQPLPSPGEACTAALVALFDEIVTRLKPTCAKVPRLKIYRVLAALYPGSLTTVAHTLKIRELHNAMLPDVNRDHAVQCHVDVLDRLAAVLGAPDNDLASVVERVVLPWLLYAHALPQASETRTATPGETSGVARLQPLPAARRRRGLTSIRGSFVTVLGILDAVGKGVTRDDMMDLMRGFLPGSKDSSIGTYISNLIGELAVIRRDVDQYVLTERGAAVLESGEPDDLSDWLLTHILGIDHVLVLLRDNGSQSKAAVTKLLQQAHPGWTSSFVPSSIMTWLRSLGVVTDNADAELELTEYGRGWADQVFWTPEPLKLDREDDDKPEALGPLSSPVGFVRIEVPVLDDILKHVAKAGAFPPSLVATLHAGLWAHARRHFAVFTGLSGSGKTLLARAYGDAISATPASGTERMLTVAIQPGWYDPSALLGYVNPLKGDAYVRTPFLEFLLSACEEPDRPYVAVLDEMNLSHPEQYLAPLLSAMETGAAVELHREAEIFDGVPNRIPYPSNLVLIGTVNMDETTHGLSDKVLDRAFTLEFWDIDLADYPGWASRSIPADDEKLIRDLLEQLLKALSPVRMHFGWRVVDDVLDFVDVASAKGGGLALTEALDRVVYAKVLPKLRGEDSKRFREALHDCQEVLGNFRLEHSKIRVATLESDLSTTGSARFWR